MRGKQGENKETRFLCTEPLQCAPGNFTGIETTNIHSTLELLYICKTVTVLIKAACRLNLAYTYRVPFSAETCQAPAPSSSQECAGALGRGGEHRGILCVLPPQHVNPRLEHSEEREPPWAAGRWGSFLRRRHFAKRVSGFD